MSKRKPNPDMRLVHLCVPMSSLPSQRLGNGCLRTTEAVQDALTGALKSCGLSRDVIAEEISRLTGHDVSVHTLNNWAAPSKEDRPTPLQFLSALIAVTDSPALVEAALKGTGYKLLPPEEVPYYEIGKLEAEKKEQAEARKAAWAKIKR